MTFPSMETWLADIGSLFNEGLTVVHFESKQWAAITLNSGLQTAIVQQTSAVAGGVGNSDQDNLIGMEINAGTFQTLESKRTETIERGAYGSYNLLKFHIYENGLIVKEYQLGTRKPIQYEVVKEVEEEFDDGGFRELDNYFEGTKLAFVDYIQPRAIVQKGFKKMVLAIIPGAKPSKYKGNISVKKTPAVENKSKDTGKAAKGASVPDDVSKVFDSKSKWTATRPKGTQQTYEVFKRNDVDWNHVRTSGDKRFIGKTNAEASGSGLAPQLPDGEFATLHHIGQDSRGPLAEASTRYHGVGKYGQDILHSQFGKSKPNPSYPIERKKFNADTREYWKLRVENK